MRKLLPLILVSISTVTYGQITFYSIPKDSELVARDLTTNVGSITISGNVNNKQSAFDSLCVKVYTDDLISDSIYQTLVYSGNDAPFSFSVQIPAELAEHKVLVYGIKDGAEALDTSIYGIVSGDVYIIEGQSNALAQGRDHESANGNKSEFIRVFGNSDSSTKGLLKNLRWFEGQGDGGFKENGHAGQWGLRVARLLVERVKIPIAIFNGACGGTPINYYERPPNYITKVNSNYGRLYYRLSLCGLQNNVRAIFWCQGETDGLNGTSTSQYIASFNNLYKSWREDYPSIEKTYIFQTKSEKIYPLNGLMAIEEAQREVTTKNKDIEIIPTSGLKADRSGTHFVYKGGYEEFGNRLFRLVARDLYKVKPEHKKGVDAPMIRTAYLDDSVTLVIEENTKALVPHNTKLPIMGFEVENRVGATIDTIMVKKNKIMLYLSKYPGDKATVSYIGQQKISENWLTTIDSIETLSFYKYPITIPSTKLSSGTRKYHRAAPIIASKPAPTLPRRNLRTVNKPVYDSCFTNKEDARNSYMNGLKDGKWIEYADVNFNKVTDTNAPYYILTVYSAGKPCNISRRYFKDGKLRDVFRFKNGLPNGIKTSFYESGKIKDEIPFTDGKINGVARTYYENGHLKGETVYLFGVENGTARNYYENGTLQGKATFQYGKINGVAITYYENGKECCEMSYVNGTVSSKISYDKNGRRLN